MNKRSKFKEPEEMTLDELKKEQLRCKTLINVFPEKTAKLLRKRLLKIEKRLNENLP